jgi:oxygen-dependent protoporphyrinogen oxidase
MWGAVRPEILEKDDDSLLELARREVESLFGPTSKPSVEKMVRWNRAMPQYLVGHTDRVATIREQVAAYPGLELIGNGYDGVGIPQCVRGAKRAVERIVERFQVAQHG